MLLGVLKEVRKGLDTRLTLQVLTLNHLIKEVLQFNSILVLKAKLSQDSEQYALETLEVPVLVDTGADDTRGKDCLSLASQEKHETVHQRQFVATVHVVGQVLRY